MFKHRIKSVSVSPDAEVDWYALERDGLSYWQEWEDGSRCFFWRRTTLFQGVT